MTRQEYTFGSGDEAVFILYTYPGEDRTSLLRSLQAMNRSFTLLCLKADDWNCDLSPWPGPLPRGESASGGGVQTLRQLTEIELPAMRERFPVLPPVYVLGYSLAGLFALWTFYESGEFAGAASCSGSLWFDGWLDYAAEAAAPEGSVVYISLGGKEERCSDPLLSQIGICTRQQDKLLAADKNIRAHTLEMNKGGHFADSGPRLAKAVQWILEHLPQA